MKTYSNSIPASQAVIDTAMFNSVVVPKVEREVEIVASDFRHFSPDDMKDMEQDILLKIYEKRGSYDPSRAGVGTWVARIVRNHVIDEHRRWLSRPERTLSDCCPGGDCDREDWLDAALLDSVPSACAWGADDEEHDGAVRATLSSLGEPDRRLLGMVVQGLDGRGMAEELSCSENVAYQRVFKAKGRFRSAYREVLRSGAGDGSYTVAA
jgi:DNA-directed RNA polymerase specialized sigma subunit, sigma24 homolog